MKKNNRAISPVVGVILMVALVILLVGVAGTYAFTTASESLDTSESRLDGLFDELNEEIGGDENSGGNENNAGGTESTVTGIVQINPRIEGATVKAINNGNVVDTDTTNEDGEYTIHTTDAENTRIVVNVENFDHQELSNPLYAGAEIPATESGDLTFTTPTETIVNDESVLVSHQVEEQVTSNKYITNSHLLQSIKEDKTSLYVLSENIDISETENWNNNNGFEPIGDYNDFFTGSLDGNGYTINGLSIDRDSSYNVGLIAASESATIENVKLENVNIVSNGGTGALIGWVESDTIINNVEVEGNINSGSEVGGVVGWNEGSSITNVQSNVNIDGTWHVGGIVGWNEESTITNAFSNSVINSNGASGGITGWNEASQISNSESTSEITTRFYGGGISGYNYISGSITDSHATGNVIGEEGIGGIVGVNELDSTISSSYYNGDVTGQLHTGGVVGEAGDGLIEKTYSTGTINGEQNTGGIVGALFGGTLQNSYSQSDVSGETETGGAIGRVSRWNTEEYKNIYSTGDVSGTENIGGISGYHGNGNLSNVYTTSTVSGTTNVGRILGQGGRDAIYNPNSGLCRNDGYGYLNNGNYDSNSNTGIDSIGAFGEPDNNGNCRGVEVESQSVNGITTTDITGENAEINMNSFDFTNTWKTTENDYPTLQNTN